MIPPNWKKYPKKININDEMYEIRMVKRIPGEPHTDCGMCDPGEKIIWIRYTQSKRGVLRTAIHEILHAMEAEHEIELKHSLVYSLEKALESFLVDNF